MQRWASADPLEIHAPGLANANLYAYVSGAALRNVDPLGLDGEAVQSGNSSASSQPTPVPFGPEGASPGTRFVFGGGPDRLVPQTDYELVTSGKQEFIYDPKADLGTIDPNKLSSEAFIQVVRNAINKALSGGGNCSGPACGTARRGEEGAGGPTNGSDAVAMGAGLIYGAGPEAGGKPNGSPGGRCASCEGSDAQQLVVGGVQVASTLGVGGAVKRGVKQAARGVSSLDDLSRAAGAIDRGGLTAAGRALQKHGGRPGSAFPAARGNPAQLNEAGQGIVDDILTSPGSTTTTRHHARFGDVMEIRALDGRGVRYDANGGFVGFLEP